jgi:hypothetical protein
MAYLTLTDPSFDKKVTLRDAYRIMDRFVRGSRRRREADLIVYMGLNPDGSTADPEALEEFLRCAGLKPPG